LCINNHNGGFRNSGKAQALGHQAKTAAGCGCQGPYAGKRGPDNHVHGCNLVFGLFNDKGKIIGNGRKLGHDTGGRRHGIKGGKAAISGEGT
jgi:hypothetical protein